MRRLTIIASMVLGAIAILAIPSSAPAESDCTYTSSGNTPIATVPVGTGTVTVYEGSGVTGTATVAAGACADNVAPTSGFDGGFAEAGAGEDPATGAADPGLVANQPDAYAVVDGSDANSDPSGFSDGYTGVSNYETGATRTDQASCMATGPDNGTAGSSNSGGCVGADAGGWVYVPGDVPTPACGNTSGNSWYGPGNQGAGQRDGCSIP